MTQSTKSDEEEIRALIEFYLRDKEMKAAQDYNARGRRFKNLTLPELEQMYIANFQKWATANDENARALFDDCHAEYTLRGITTPSTPETTAALKLLIQRAKGVVSEMEDDLQREYQFGRSLLEDATAALDDTKEKPGN